ncbi:aminopeptidase P family protein [bacterium]|nr:aminopeptidase P family protein [bacterium]MCI0566081.1 aminopeptidase P family protein [bacterium]
MFSRETYRGRRSRLIERAGAGIAFIPTAREKIRNHDIPFPFRPDSNFIYLTGFAEQDAALLLIGGKNPRSILFCMTPDPEEAVWVEAPVGPKAAKKAFGFDETHNIAKLDEIFDRELAKLRRNDTLWYPVAEDKEWDAWILERINKQLRKSRQSGFETPAIRDVRIPLGDMRRVKSEEEISVIRESARIGCIGHHIALSKRRAWSQFMRESNLMAEITHTFERYGCAHSYPPIVAGGKNACILHYTTNSDPLRHGDLVLIDAGCELNYYASDITRTFPINGKWSPEQLAVYKAVLAAQKAGIAAVKPGVRYDVPHKAVVRVLGRELEKAGVVKSAKEFVKQTLDPNVPDFKKIFPHRTGHWMGIDVHDVGGYFDSDGKPRKLEKDNVLTIEPGVYLREDLCKELGIPKKFWDIAVRIEDDVLVTENGHEVLTADAPKDPEDLEF